jgi:hypothetical protein
MALYLQTPQQLDAVRSLGQPLPWTARALVLRVSAYMKAGDPRLDMAIAEMHRFLDQGGKIGTESPPFAVEVKKLAPQTAPVSEMVLGAQAGE